MGHPQWLALVVNGAGTKVRLMDDRRSLIAYLNSFILWFPLRGCWKGVDEGACLWGADWQVAYRATSLDKNRNSQQLCGFVFEGHIYVMVTLPVDLNIAPASLPLPQRVPTLSVAARGRTLHGVH